MAELFDAINLILKPFSEQEILRLSAVWLKPRG
jgi:hypothetical protein